VNAGSAAEFEPERPRLFGLAYRLLGSAADAEDIVQDAFLRWEKEDRSRLASPPAWLTRVVTNLCLNLLTSARQRRETYPGPWLPEPVLTDGGLLGPLETAERREAVSLALLALLERLTPAERGVFVLREAFGYSYRDIGGVLGLSEVNCRQIHRRSARRLGERPARFTPSAQQRRAITERFLAAAGTGDLAGLEALLTDDVVSWADGGGKVVVARRPVRGRERVAPYLIGGMRWMARHIADPQVWIGEVNGEPAVIGALGGTVIGVLVLEITDRHISGIRAVANPDKLTFLTRQMSRPAPLSGQ
jgi:RNA polymerase sigma-70 factor (ECF subfamily)